MSDGKDLFEIFKDSSQDKETSRLIDSWNKFQLSPDKQSLIPVSGLMEFIQTYHDDNKTIQNTWGWFKKR
jgi:hypothetical protein